MKHNYTKEQLEKVVKQSFSIAEVCRKLNIRPTGGNYKTLKCKFKKFDIDTSFFTGQGWNVGLKHNPSPAKDLCELLVENSITQSFKLKNKLFKEGLKERKCEICMLSEWNNLPIPTELDHINGINTDNRIINLRILCPNCHAQTKNYRGKNKLSALSEKKDVEYRKFRETLTDNADGNPEPSLIKEEGAETRHDTPKERSMVKV